MASFDPLKLKPELVKAAKKQGFTGPTPIQQLVVPAVMSGKDALVEAMTGSGKTLAYGWPLLDREPAQHAFPETLVVVPTRELAEQIEAELVRSRGTLDRPVVLLTGRGGMDKQKLALDAGCSIVVGTIGRIEELLERKLLRLDKVRTLVLDEVDEMMKNGFSANLATLFKSMPKERQTLLFSATIPTDVEAVAKQFTKQAVRLKLSKARELPAELTHRSLYTAVDERVGQLAAYMEAQKPFQTIVFCGTRHETEEVKLALDDLGVEVEFLHGELSPLKRRQLLEKFRSGDLPVLVASDLAARGLDLPGVDLIVNYSLPLGTAAYLHRAGRTGRAGRPGVVLSLVIGQQKEQFDRLKESITFESMEISSRGKVFSHPPRTREERDQTFGVRPRTKGPPPVRERPVDAPPRKPAGAGPEKYAGPHAGGRPGGRSGAAKGKPPRR